MDKHKLTLTGRIGEDGVMRYHDALWQERFGKFKSRHLGLDFVLTVHAVKDAKSRAQQDFYFGVVLPAFLEATGNADKDDMDLVLRSKFLKRIRTIDGEDYVHIPSLQIDDIELDRASFSRYIELCLNLLYESGGSIPEEKNTDDWRHYDKDKK